MSRRFRAEKLYIIIGLTIIFTFLLAGMASAATERIYNPYYGTTERILPNTVNSAVSQSFRPYCGGDVVSVKLELRSDNTVDGPDAGTTPNEVEVFFSDMSASSPLLCKSNPVSIAQGGYQQYTFTIPYSSYRSYMDGGIDCCFILANKDGAMIRYRVESSSSLDYPRGWVGIGGEITYRDWEYYISKTFYSVPDDDMNFDMTLNVLQQYTVTFNYRDAAGNPTSSSVKVYCGEAATAPAPPAADCYTFTGWDKTFAVVRDNLTVNALYTQPGPYTVTFKDRDGVTIGAPQTVNCGGDAAAPTPPAVDCYDFTGWDKIFTDVHGNLTVNALYEHLGPYTVTFNYKDAAGNPASTNVTVVCGGDAAAPAAPPVDCYHFIGWDKTFTGIHGDLAVDAQYEQLGPYTVTFKDKDGITLGTPQTVTCGGDATVSAPPDVDCYNFTGWSDGANIITDFSNITADLTVTARYEQLGPYSVTFMGKDGVAIGAPQTVTCGGDAAAPTPPSVDCYTFTGWDKSFNNVHGDLTVNALYQQLGPYTVTFSYKDAAGNPASSDVAVMCGEDAAAPALPSVGCYNFTGWDKTFADIHGGLVVNAMYGRLGPYTVTFKDKDGTVIGAPQQVYCGEAVTVPEPPAVDCYIFTGWSDGTSIITDFTNITADLTVSAQYGQLGPYTVTFNYKDTDGNPASTGVAVNCGEDAVAPAPPAADGFTFNGWDSIFNDVHSDLAVNALYIQGPYTVTFDLAGGTPTGGGELTQSVAYNGTATPPTTEKEGYIFIGWDKPLDNITGSTTITAQWSEITIKYSYSVLNEVSKTAQLKLIEGASGEVNIPGVIDGYTITRIGSLISEVGVGGFKANNIFVPAEGVPDTAVTSVTIPPTVTCIGDYAFYDCDALAIVNIPSGVSYYGQCAFAHCDSLPGITIPYGITSLSHSMFAYCTNLKEVVIPDSVIGTGESVFLGCSSLTSVTIPNSLTSISRGTFASCTGLTGIDIPDSVENIGMQAFWCSTGLTSVTIPDNVTGIGESAFDGCINLASASFHGDAPANFGAQVFNNTAPGFTIYYIDGRTGWTSPTWQGYNTRIFAGVVTFDLAGGTRTGGGELAQLVMYNGSAAAPAAEKDGCTFIGWDKTLDNITCATTITALWEPLLTSVTFDQPGTYGPAEGTETINGDVVIAVRGVTLQNTIITGSLTLAEGISDGDVTLSGVIIYGATIVNGGGANSVVLDGCTTADIIVTRSGVRVVASGSTSVGFVTLQTGAVLVEVSCDGPGFGTVTISETVPAGAQITLSGTFDKVNVNAGQANVVIENGSVGSLNVGESASGSTISIASQVTVSDLTLDAAADITGQVAISSAYVNVPGTSMETAPAALTLADGVTVTVNNVIVTQSYTQSCNKPVIESITPSISLVKLNTTVDFMADFSDGDLSDTHTATWYWGSGEISAGTVSESGGDGSVRDSYVYDTPGVYTVRLRIEDNHSEYCDEYYQYIVVYDPDGGFVTGGGWIDSPEGSYAEDPGLAGKATFGFVSKYQKGAAGPAGQTEFQFNLADLDFHSSSCEWLVIAGARAQYKGEGTINGNAGYGFMLTAIDGEISGGGGEDRFRIKIWDKATETVIYDNQSGADDAAELTTALAGGSIVIHKSK